MAEWINAKDRLPKEDGEYIVAYRRDDNCDMIVTVLPFSVDCGFVDENPDGGFWEVDYVEYWLPLPKPPKELAS